MLTLPGTDTFVNFLQSANAYDCNLVTVPGIIRLFIAVLAKDEEPISINPLFKVKFVNAVQFSKALSPMVTTDAGIIMLLIAEQDLNA